MNIKKISAVFFSAVMIFAMTSCSKKETPEEESYYFNGAQSLNDAKGHMAQGKISSQNFFLTVTDNNGEVETYTEFYRIDEKEVRLIRYDDYQTRFIREEDKYIVIDDVKETAAVYPYENTHDDIMLSDMDFLISVIDMALAGELTSSTFSEESKGTFTETYRTEKKEQFIFEFKEGKLSRITLSDKSDKTIAVYEIYYDSKGGKKSLFDYKGYKVTNMRIEKTDADTTEE